MQPTTKLLAILLIGYGMAFTIQAQNTLPNSGKKQKKKLTIFQRLAKKHKEKQEVDVNLPKKTAAYTKTSAVQSPVSNKKQSSKFKSKNRSSSVKFHNVAMASCSSRSCKHPFEQFNIEEAALLAIKAEAKLKAAYTYQILNEYVNLDMKADDATYIIGVAGNNPLLLEMFKDLSGKVKLRGKPMIVEAWDPSRDIGDYHALFITNLNSNNVEYITKKVVGEKVVTLTDLSKDEVGRKAFIRFHNVSNKVKFTIDNYESISGLSFNEKLLDMSYEESN